jgi:hypothetical protein
MYGIWAIHPLIKKKLSISNAWPKFLTTSLRNHRNAKQFGERTVVRPKFGS